MLDIRQAQDGRFCQRRIARVLDPNFGPQLLELFVSQSHRLFSTYHIGLRGF